MMSNENAQRRWLRRRFLSAADAGNAMTWFREILDPGRNMGIDYERLAESVLSPSTGPDTGFREHVMDLRGTIEAALPEAESTRTVWVLARVAGWKAEKIARELATNAEKIGDTLARADREVEDRLYVMGALGGRS